MEKTTDIHPAIIFDFGGVLIDWNAHHLYRKFFDGDYAATEQFLNEIGFAEWNFQQDSGRPFAEGVAEMLPRFPQYAELIKAYDERWEETITGPIQPTVDILQTLKQNGYPVYGLTNWSAEKYPIIRSRYEFLDWFDDIVVSGEVKIAKPDPRIFALALEKAGRPASECIFIDDSEKNVTVASQLGFKAIHFKSPEQLRAELAQIGVM
jgi:2-haloacid dehalogenase